MCNENQKSSLSNKLKKFPIAIFDKVCQFITGNDSIEAPCNLHFLEIPTDLSKRKLGNARWNSPKLTWMPFIEIMAISASFVVVMALKTS